MFYDNLPRFSPPMGWGGGLDIPPYSGCVSNPLPHPIFNDLFPEIIKNGCEGEKQVRRHKTAKKEQKRPFRPVPPVFGIFKGYPFIKCSKTAQNSPRELKFSQNRHFVQIEPSRAQKPSNMMILGPEIDSFTADLGRILWFCLILPWNRVSVADLTKTDEDSMQKTVHISLKYLQWCISLRFHSLSDLSEIRF